MRRALALGVALLLVASCTGGGEDDDAEPSPTSGDEATTTLVDRSGIALPGVAGETTSTIVEVGTARITGTVQGPQGPVVGATVRIERLVAGREIRTDLVTGPDGRFLLENAPGGRYRVRAFLAPRLVQAEPEIRFLEDGAEHDIPLTVTDLSGVHVVADVAPEPPLLDKPVNLVVLVLTREVGADGVVHSAPVVGITVELAGLGRWRLRDDAPSSEPDESTTSSTFDLSTTTTEEEPANVATTDSSGRVRFELECDAPGGPGLYLRIPVRVSSSQTEPDGSTTTSSRVETQSFDLELPDCVDPKTTTTTTAATTTSAGE